MSNVARKIIPGLLAGAMVALTACGGGGEAPGAESADKPQSISYWSYWKDGEPQQKVIAQAIADWEKETGIKVEVQWQGRSVTQKLTPALNTNKVPDLVDSSFSKLAPILAETKQAAPLDEAYATKLEDGKSAGDIIPAKFQEYEGLMVDGKPWMVPYQITTEAVWYNAAKHPELKSAPPKTWDEFMKTLADLKSSGMAPLAQDGDIGGYNGMWFVSGYVREHGPGSFMKLVEDKTGEAWKSEDAKTIAQRIEKLVADGSFLDGYNASKFPAQQQAWASDKAALLLNGSWIPTETSTYVAKGFEFGAFPLPSEQQDKKYTRADFSGFAVPAKAKNAKWGANFATFLLKKKYQDALGSEAKILPIRDDSTVVPELQILKDEIASADAVYQQNDGVTLPGYTEKVFWPVLSELVLGNIKSDEFVNRMAEAQASYWKDQG